MGHGIGAKAASSELLCKHCGRLLERKFAFCPYCGEKV
jgi:RNA polymerase subunit RPABC4/transcription elongation factor Spt4